MKLADTIEYETNDYGWAAQLPSEHGTLFGLPLTVDIATRHIPTEPTELPTIHENQQRLLTTILERIGPILQEAENQLEGYYIRAGANFEEIRPMLANPKVWIRLADSDDLRRPYPREDNEWTLVVGFENAPDFGHHIEFDLDHCIDVWAGD
jgi:hypothetical protein